MSPPCLLTWLYTYKKSVTAIPEVLGHAIKDYEVTEAGKVFLLKERKPVSRFVILNCNAFSEISIFKEITTANLAKSNIEKLYSDKNSGLLSGVKKKNQNQILCKSSIYPSFLGHKYVLYCFLHTPVAKGILFCFFC